MEKLKDLAKKSKDSIQNEGGVIFAKRAAKYAYYKKFPNQKKREFKDVLIINGCALPHPARYRVDHQIEQLASAGITADSVFYDQLNIDQLKHYQAFIFFRCPITDTVREFIEQAKYFNKTCFYDIDDLVIDTKYTDKIDYVANMSSVDKELYDSGVNRMRETLELCDYAITTTDRLSEELGKYTSEVFINRNVASDEMVSLSLQALSKKHLKDSSRIVLGYFSGSITHNENFELVAPALVNIFKKYPNVYLKIAGILDVPEILSEYADRILTIGFMDWKELPSEVASCDINLAPLRGSIFNEAKSENKWTEASLVKVPTVASDVGAFRAVIKHGLTGVLVEPGESWQESLEGLIDDENTRNTIAEAAYAEVIEQHTTVGAAHKLAKFITEKMQPSIGFVLPTSDISGGVNVILKHADVLRRNGWNVTLIDDVHKKALKKSMKSYEYRFEIPGYNTVISHRVKLNAYFDSMVATLWTTVDFVKDYPNVKRRQYLVQGFETGFAPWGSGEGKFRANATYSDRTNLEYLTISKWCQRWLKEQFNKDARYTPNGIDLENYPYHERVFSKDKRIKILIEGDSRSEYKNTDEAFRIVAKLDPKRYEIAYLSYRKEPKDWYKVDRFYNRISPEKVGEVYADNDILIKTSLLESFSYPPLEMMATGGLALVIPNDGNVEYLKDKYNCLFYKHGAVDAGVAAIELLSRDKALRTQLIKNGLETAKGYSWDNIESSIIALYK